jgi:hypothetical protein
LNIPSIPDIPQINFPELNLPNLQLPDFKLPNFSIPKIDIPSIPIQFGFEPLVALFGALKQPDIRSEIKKGLDSDPFFYMVVWITPPELSVGASVGVAPALPPFPNVPTSLPSMPKLPGI